MAEEPAKITVQTDLYTGKKFERSFTVYSDAAMTTVRQWQSGETLRAAMRENPAGAIILTPTAEIGDNGTGTVTIDETLTKIIPTAQQFDVPRVYWIDVDRVDADGNPWPFMRIKVNVRAGVTEDV